MDLEEFGLSLHDKKMLFQEGRQTIMKWIYATPLEQNGLVLSWKLWPSLNIKIVLAILHLMELVDKFVAREMQDGQEGMPGQCGGY